MQPSPPPSLGKLFREKGSRLYSLPKELQEEIKSQVRDLRARELSEQIVRAETQDAYTLFLNLVRRFIREAEQGELNPDAFYDPHSRPNMRVINKTCLQFVEIRCMRIVSKMHSLVDIRDLASVPPELDPLRELIIQLAIRRNSKNNQALRTLRGNSYVEELIYSIQRVVDLSYTVIKTSIRNIRNDATPLSEAALALSNECCDQFIMIIGNHDNTPELKEEAKRLLFQMLQNLQNIPQHGDSLSQSVRAMYNMMDEKIKQHRQGGRKISKSSKKQLINKSKRRNKKNRKKTLRLRNNK